jgi:tetratricopeptide (TPR) repeat protein
MVMVPGQGWEEKQVVQTSSRIKVMKNATLILNNPTMKVNPNPRQAKPRVGTDDGISDKTLNGLIMVFMLLMLGIAVASASNRDGVSDETVLQHAVVDVDNGRFDEAARKLRALSVRHPESAYVSYLLGICTMQREQAMEEAIAHLSKCANRVADNARPCLRADGEVPVMALYLLGSAMESAGQAEAASQAYEQYLLAAAQSTETNLSPRVIGMIQRKVDSLRGMEQSTEQPLLVTTR